MRPLIECVPNFSEGRNPAVIQAIADAIRAVEGVRLLDIDPGATTHRTVMTFVGPPEPVIEAAYQAIKTAAALIDMRTHQGAHPRMGATDVCPLIPISGISLADTVEYAHDLARRVGDTLGIPVYLYEQAATQPTRKNLADIRAGEYEGFAAKIYQPEWKPDYGPQEFHEQSGATVIGVRDFLVAYNINLNTRSVPRANAVAFDIRESGRVKLADGKPVLDPQGQPVRIPGACRGVKAIGWYIDEFGIAQVSANLTDLTASPLHEVFDKTCEAAAKRGLRVTGSELVGLIPLRCLTEAGRFFLRKQGLSEGVSEADLVHIAIRSLGLNEVKPFDPQQKILEYLVADPGHTRLTGLSVQGFCDELASDAPAPGGGSVSALAGALGASLGTMVANLSAGKTGGMGMLPTFSTLAVTGQALKDELLYCVNEDTAAFNQVMAAFRLPKTTPTEAETRTAAIQAATRYAAEVPLRIMRTALRVLPVLQAVAETGNPQAITDAGVGAWCVLTALQGAALNVRINLASLQDADYVSHLTAEVSSLLDQGTQAHQAVMAQVMARMG